MFPTYFPVTYSLPHMPINFALILQHQTPHHEVIYSS